MDQHYDYKQFAILYVDDEEMSLVSFTRAFEDQFRILTASKARDGLRLLEEHQNEIGLLLTDQKMPGEKGVWLLEKARQINPKIVRILVTAYTEYEVAIAAINTGAIYKYVAKPWEPEQLEITLKRGLEFFIVQHERDQLLAEKLSVLHNMMIADRVVSIGLLASGFSHHVRNSLQAVQTFLDLAPVKVEMEKQEAGALRDPDFWKEYYQTARTQLQRIETMLKDLWQASEKPAPAFNDRVRVGAVLAETLSTLEPELTRKQLVVENRVSLELPELHVEGAKFSRLFDLLLRDELASLPAGSRITIEARTLNDRPEDKREIEITISDNGPGLQKDALRLLFDPFTIRTDTPNEFGIHLMTCYFIVHHHGGRIEAKGHPEGGTIFTIRLPVKGVEAAPPAATTNLVDRLRLNESLWQKLISS